MRLSTETRAIGGNPMMGRTGKEGKMGEKKCIHEEESLCRRKKKERKKGRGKRYHDRLNLSDSDPDPDPAGAPA